MAHARRKFMDIVKITKTKGIASDIVDIIGKLYDIEKKITNLTYDKIYNANAKPWGLPRGCSNPHGFVLQFVLCSYENKDIVPINASTI